jgi:hypothetical protein
MRRVSDREAGMRPATAERGQAAATIASPGGRCRVHHPLLCVRFLVLESGRSAVGRVLPPTYDLPVYH